MTIFRDRPFSSLNLSTVGCRPWSGWSRCRLMAKTPLTPLACLRSKVWLKTPLAGSQLWSFTKQARIHPFGKKGDIGAASVFVPTLDGKTLKFSVNDNGEIRDTETQSKWNVLGRAVAGPLEGKQLQSIVNGNHFWFAWAVFKPETRVFGLSE